MRAIPFPLAVGGRVDVDLDVWRRTARRFDIDNVCKPSLDLLTAAGVIEDDALVDRLHVRRMGQVPEAACFPNWRSGVIDVLVRAGDS